MMAWGSGPVFAVLSDRGWGSTPQNRLAGHPGEARLMPAYAQRNPGASSLPHPPRDQEPGICQRNRPSLGSSAAAFVDPRELDCQLSEPCEARGIDVRGWEVRGEYRVRDGREREDIRGPRKGS